MRRKSAAIAALLAAAVGLWARPAPAATLTYVAFGDSITAGLGDSRSQPGYPPQLEKLLAKEGVEAQVINAGLSGEETTEGLSRITGLLNSGLDGVLIMEGTNDVTKVAEGVLSLETVVFNLDQMARRAQTRRITPVQSTIIPRPHYARLDHTNTISLTLTWQIRKLAIDTGRKLADIWDGFDLGRDPTALDTLYSALPDDTVGHPNDLGYDRIAQFFADILLDRDTVPPVLGEFEPTFVQRLIPADSTFRGVVYEPKDASGVDLGETFLLINGRVVAEANRNKSNKRMAVMEYEGPEGVGCRAEVTIRTQDRNDPPNVVERLLQLFDVAGRTVLPGDVDFDCLIDGNDLVILGLHFGAESGDDRYFTRYDLNRDGVIDGNDLAQMAKNFGRSSL